MGFPAGLAGACSYAVIIGMAKETSSIEMNTIPIAETTSKTEPPITAANIKILLCFFLSFREVAVGGTEPGAAEETGGGGSGGAIFGTTEGGGGTDNGLNGLGDGDGEGESSGAGAGARASASGI
nr:hypothetical protein Iba_chr11aCG17250 [Ipomoea batatas]